MTSLHADESFLDHYQFTHDPFAARVPGFKFFPALRKPVLGQLHHLARYSQLLLVVSGPDGSGKTLLRQALVASTNKQSVVSVVVSAKGSTDPASILRQVAQGLQVQRPDLPAVLAQVAQLALTGQDVYILIDDAEDLSDAALTMLMSLAAGNAEGRAHVFLFAESQLLPRLDHVSAGDERFHVIELQPYSEDETRDYLSQRLEGAGQGVELLTEEQLEEIQERSGGWPGLVNEVARDVLVDDMLAQRAKGARGGFAFNLPRKHLLALCVVIVGVMAAWFMQGRVADDADAPVITELPLGEVAPVQVQAEVPASGAPAIQFEGANQPLPLPLVGEAQPVIREPLAQAAGLGGVEESEGVGAAIARGMAVDAVPVVPVAPVVQAAPAPAPAPATVPVAPGPAAKPVVPVAKPVAPTVVASQAPRSQAPAASANSTGSAGWYATQAGSRFTLQILGARQESGAQAFVKAHGSEYRYFKKLHQGQPLYVVTYGSFATRDAAQAALRSLPAKVQAGKPWPRNFAGIQQEIAQAR